MENTSLNKLILAILILISSCASIEDNKSNPLTEKWKLPNQEGNGILKIKFNSEKENLSIKNYSLRISKSFPNPKFENHMQGASPLPIFIESIQYAYPIVHNAEYSHKEDLKTNEVSEYELPAGEYYASIDTTLNEDFSISPKESQSLLLKFGYEHDPLWIRSKPTKYESKECVSSFMGEEGNATWNIASCPLLVIKENQTTNINIQISKTKPTRFGIRFVKFFPGILFLAPITNWGGTYYYRDYRVELTNPISTKK